jgi:uncharacterized membrane protein
MNRKMILGLAVVMLSVLLIEMPILTHQPHTPRQTIAASKRMLSLIVFLALVVLGGYLFYQGKKQQQEERENQFPD